MVQQMTVSFSKGKANETSIRHNNRSLDSEHFDYDKAGHRHILQEYTSMNEVLVHRDIRKVYQEQFGEAVEQYNARQKRKSRKIDNFYQKVKTSKNQRTQYEFIVQVGNRENYLSQNRKTSQNWQAAKNILTEFEHDFEERNQNLIVYNAVIHMDEAGAPHMHLNVVPVAHLNHAKKGLTVKPSFNKALIEEGFRNDPKDGRKLFSDFQHKEAEALANVARSYGIERVRGFQNNLKNVHEYKQAMRENDKLLQQNYDLVKQNKLLSAKNAEKERKSVDLDNELDLKFKRNQTVNQAVAEVSLGYQTKIDSLNKTITEQDEFLLHRQAELEEKDRQITKLQKFKKVVFDVLQESKMLVKTVGWRFMNTLLGQELTKADIFDKNEFKEAGWSEKDMDIVNKGHEIGLDSINSHSHLSKQKKVQQQREINNFDFDSDRGLER